MAASNSNVQFLTADQVQSQTIYFLRFFLIVMVVFIHASLDDNEGYFYENGYSLFVFITFRVLNGSPPWCFLPVFCFSVRVFPLVSMEKI